MATTKDTREDLPLIQHNHLQLANPYCYITWHNRTSLVVYRSSSWAAVFCSSGSEATQEGVSCKRTACTHQQFITPCGVSSCSGYFQGRLLRGETSDNLQPTPARGRNFCGAPFHQRMAEGGLANRQRDECVSFTSWRGQAPNANCNG